VPNPTDTTARKKKFAANLQRLMRERRLSVPETARRAGIADRKRFYRWANNGIARAARAHHDDLNGLRRLFRLSTMEDLWGDPPEVAVEDQLIMGVWAKPQYAYALKLLFLLDKLPAPEAEALRRQIDEAVDLETRHEVPKQLLPLLTGKQIVALVRRRSEKAYANLVRHYGDDSDKYPKVLGAMMTERGIPDPIDYLIRYWEAQDTA